MAETKTKKKAAAKKTTKKSTSKKSNVVQPKVSATTSASPVSDAEKNVTLAQDPDITMPEPQRVTGEVWNTDPGETPVVVLPGGSPPEDKTGAKPNLTLEQRVSRIESALLRATGINFNEFPVE